MIPADLLREVASKQGLTLVSALLVSNIQAELEREKHRLKDWQEAGFGAEMKFMNRDPALFVELERFLPNVKSILSFCISYYDGNPSLALPKGHGRIARYAWGEDYHSVIPMKLNAFVIDLRERLEQDFKFRVFSDAVPLLERSLARLGNLGFVGKNTLLIRPGIGSYSFLGEVLLDIEVEGEKEGVKSPGCKSCFRCGSACPTGAIVEPFKIDASKCISYLTIEKRTEFSEWEESAVGEWLFGCDICQDVCPFNNKSVDTSLSFREFTKGDRRSLSLKEVLSIRTDTDYKLKFRGSAILRAKREQLLRNACFVTANLKAIELLGDLKEISTSDPSELVRNSAVRAIKRLSAD